MRAILLFLGMTSFTFSQAPSVKPDPLAPIQDVPGLPRVLLIGDSISIGYTLDVRAELEGIANVHRPPTNGGPTLRGLDQLDSWLGDQPWDVIHFNWGLHDLKHIAADSEPRHAGALVPVEEGEPMVPLDAYEENLRRLVKRLQKTNASLIWCATTPIPLGARGRLPADGPRYNAVARSLMRAHGIPVNDLFSFASPHLEKIQRPKDVHFTPEGSALLASEVTREIVRALPIRAKIARASKALPPLTSLKESAALPPLLTSPDLSVSDWPQIRAGLTDKLAFYEYGFAPGPPGRPRFQVLREDRLALGGKATKREVRVHFGPPTTPSFDLLLYLPNTGPNPAPVFLGLNFNGNHTITSDPEITITESWVPGRGEGVVDNRATAASRGTSAARWPIEAIIARGYAVATIYHGDLDPDRDYPNDGIQAHLTGNLAEEQADYAWGSLQAWAYGLSRGADYLMSCPDIDPTRIAVMGHSGNGKAALVAGAFDERFSLVISNQAGCGGAALARRRHGETVLAINTNFPHWFSGAFKHFNEREDLLPMDQHTLLAAVGPRPLLICSATGDDWADPEGEFLAAKEASLVYDWLGKASLSMANMPQENTLLNHTVGYHIRPGKHGIGLEDWTVFMDFADKHWGLK